MDTDSPGFRSTMRFWARVLKRALVWTWRHPLISLGAPFAVALLTLPLLYLYSWLWGEPEAASVLRGLVLTTAATAILAMLVLIYGILRSAAELCHSAGDAQVKQAQRERDALRSQLDAHKMAAASAVTAADRARAELTALRSNEALYCRLAEVRQKADAFVHKQRAIHVAGGSPVAPGNVPNTAVEFKAALTRVLNGTLWESLDIGDPPEVHSEFRRYKYVETRIIPAIDTVIARLTPPK